MGDTVLEQMGVMALHPLEPLHEGGREAVAVLVAHEAGEGLQGLPPSGSVWVWASATIWRRCSTRRRKT